MRYVSTNQFLKLFHSLFQDTSELKHKIETINWRDIVSFVFILQI